MDSEKNKLRGLISDYLCQQKFMQLATVRDGYPWVCSVWQAADEDLNIYFFSSVTRRHSREIEQSNKVAGALASPHETQDKPRGLQYEGSVEVLEYAEDVKTARSLYEGRVFDSETIDGFMSHKERPHAFYKITPKKFVLFDVVNYPDNPRQEYEV